VNVEKSDMKKDNNSDSGSVIQDKKLKIVTIGDSHARGCAMNLKSDLGDTYEVKRLHQTRSWDRYFGSYCQK
jgi:hypothetical protein